MKRIARTAVLLFAVLFTGVPGPAAADEADCTLQPMEGSKKVHLKGGVIADMIWSACNSMTTDVVFSPMSADVLNAPTIALRRAADLVAELEEKNGEKICPFNGDISASFRARIGKGSPYVFGENIPISNFDVPDWDGSSVSVRREEKGSVKLTVRYWANP